MTWGRPKTANTGSGSAPPPRTGRQAAVEYPLECELLGQTETHWNVKPVDGGAALWLEAAEFVVQKVVVDGKPKTVTRMRGGMDSYSGVSFHGTSVVLVTRKAKAPE